MKLKIKNIVNTSMTINNNPCFDEAVQKDIVELVLIKQINVLVKKLEDICDFEEEDFPSCRYINGDYYVDSVDLYEEEYDGFKGYKVFISNIFKSFFKEYDNDFYNDYLGIEVVFFLEKGLSNLILLESNYSSC